MLFQPDIRVNLKKQNLRAVFAIRISREELIECLHKQLEEFQSSS